MNKQEGNKIGRDFRNGDKEKRRLGDEKKNGVLSSVLITSIKINIKIVSKQTYLIFVLRNKLFQ